MSSAATGDELTMLKAGALRSPHGFFGRTGGVSTGLCASLNMGFGTKDDPAHVRENRARALAALGGEADNAPAKGARLVTLYQIHSATAVVAAAWDDGVRPQADALVTDAPGLFLGILTADCAPILFEDAAAGVVGAAHAGWKGAFSGVIEATVRAMEQMGAQRHRIAAAVGPCIQKRSYEVDEAYRRRFVAADPANDAFFAAGATGEAAGHAFFDLEGYCLARLAACGIARAEGLGADTCSDERRFFSYRRACQRGEGDYGRQISIIGL